MIVCKWKKQLKLQKKCNTKVVVSLSNQRIVKEYKKQVHNFVASADIVFANLYEAHALSNTSQVHLMIDQFLSRNDDKEYLITLGRRGAIYFKNGKAFYNNNEIGSGAGGTGGTAVFG